jgi:hypothetical protein
MKSGDMILSFEERQGDKKLYPDQSKPNTVSRLGAHDEFEPNLFESAM